MEKPSVARMVHFVGFDGSCRAATVTEVHDNEVVDLEVHHASELKDRSRIAHDEEKSSTTWHWPERV